MFKNINKKLQMFCLENAERCTTKYKKTRKFKYLMRSMDWLKCSVYFTTDHDELNYLKNSCKTILNKYE